MLFLFYWIGVTGFSGTVTVVCSPLPSQVSFHHRSSPPPPSPSHSPRSNPHYTVRIYESFLSFLNPPTSFIHMKSGICFSCFIKNLLWFWLVLHSTYRKIFKYVYIFKYRLRYKILQGTWCLQGSWSIKAETSYKMPYSAHWVQKPK